MLANILIVFVILALGFSTTGIAFAADEPPSFSLTIRAYIDGYSQLIIQGDNVYWHHIAAAAPGRHAFSKEPTYVNGTAWYPTWPDSPDAENKDCNCTSSTLSSVNPALPEGQRFVLKVIEARYSVFISQQPNADNNYTLIIDFNDWPPDGPAWYAVEVVPMPAWQQMNIDGFGDPNAVGVSALEVFHGQLYAGASNFTNGGQVWRLQKDGQWQPVSEPGFGFGSWTNKAILDLIVFQGQLFAGTGWGQPTGQVWRSTDGMHWQNVTDNGFGDAQNFSVASFIVFNDMLYAGTGNNYNAQIWRSSSGRSGTWKQVGFPGPGFPGGADSLAVYNGALYAAIEPTGPENSLQVWRSYNGNDWVSVIADGFGDPANISPGGFAQFDGYLYLGTQNKTTGAQLWRTRDGRNWKQVVGNGFDDLNNGKMKSASLEWLSLRCGR